MKPKHILFGMLALFAASCANDEMNEVAALKQNGIQVTAGLDANTRVGFEQDGDVTHAFWEEGDQITLYAPSQGALNYQVSTLGEGGYSATFSAIDDVLKNTDETIYAAHRADMEADIADGMATLPNTYTWTDEHPLPFAYAISKVADGKLNLSFEHVFAYLKLTLNEETVAGSTRSDKSIAVIEVSTTSDEPLANLYGFYSIPEQQYVIEKGSNHLLLTLQEPFTPTGDNEKSVYIPILPQPEGATITINIYSDYEANDCLLTVSKEVPSTGFIAGHAYTYSPQLSFIKEGKTITLIEAGTLSQAISATAKDTITSLKIIGPLNGDDIRFIREMAGVDVRGDATEGKLVDLDISEASIVEGGASYYSSGYTSYTTENNVIGELMFAETILERIQLPQNITSIADRSFQFSSLTNISIPNNVTTIGSQVFYNCSSLTDVSIGLGVTTIGASAFSRCTSLANITIPDGIAEIADYTFSECSSLSGVVIGGDVTSIGAYAFQLCTSLPTITLPESLLSIGEEAFERCTLLSKVTCNAATPPTLGSSALKNIASSATLNVPSGTYSAYMASDWAQYFTTIDDGEEHGSYENGVATVVTAGTLSTLIPEDEKYTITALKVVGPLNGDDIRFIREMAGRDVNGNETEGQLVDLDLSEASIVEGGGEYLDSNGLGYNYTSKNEVGRSMFLQTIIKSITLPQNITSIDTGAFESCSFLTSIDIPNSVTEIGVLSFYRCTLLENVEFSTESSLSSIGAGAFSECYSLSSIDIPISVSSIGERAFQGCIGIKDVKINSESSFTSIGVQAFWGCSSLISVTIGNGVTSIGEQAFYECDQLKNVVISSQSSLASIGEHAFSECSSLTSIIIPDGVTSIGDCAFQGCTQLENVLISSQSSLVSIGNSAFAHCSSLISINIPDGVTSISSQTFYDCTLLEIVEISSQSSLTLIGERAFDNCSSLMSINIPDGVTSIGERVFSNCTSLKDVTISTHSSLVSISSRVFDGCSSLISINIPDGVVSIGERGFASCTSLKDVTISAHSSMASISSWAFDGCSSLISINIPDDVTSIGEGSFAYCRSLTSINLPDALTSIGINAFFNCSSLTSITIPDGVTSIGYRTFYGCTLLEIVEIPSQSSLSLIDDEAFYDCSSLHLITIPGSVTSIGNSAFKECSSLTSINIPTSAIEIGYDAFMDCTSLAEVNCNATIPPSLGSSVFDRIASPSTLIVPTGCTTSYSESDWAQYFTTIKGENDTNGSDGNVDNLPAEEW